MILWGSLIVLAVLSTAAYRLGRRKAIRAGAGHSRPGYQGAYVTLWTAAPAAALLMLFVVTGSRIEQSLLTHNPPPAVAAMPAELAEKFYSDAHYIARGGTVDTSLYSAELQTALTAKSEQARRNHGLLFGAVLMLAATLALVGGAIALRRLSTTFRARNRVEGWVGGLLVASSALAILTTVGIVASLAYEALRFFGSVPPHEFLFGTEWSPQIAMRADQVAATGAFGALPLFAGTFLVMIIAMIVAAPIGLFSAIYLSEYASRPVRSVVKPLLEILAGIPTVVYGFFAALTVGPLFRAGFNALGAQLGGPLGDYLMQVQNQMALTAGVVMGIMLIPFVSSLSDDIINAVPQSLRDGSLAMGATQSETIKRVVLPAALPGVAGALLLAVSRAVGETMIVTMAAGLQAKLTVNPLETVTTVTVQIVTLLTGDQEFDSPKTLAAFGLGLTLFIVTLGLNLAAMRIVQKYREQYD